MKTDINLNDYYSINEVIKLCNISRTSVLHHIKQKNFKTVFVGFKYYILKKDIDLYNAYHRMIEHNKK